MTFGQAFIRCVKISRQTGRTMYCCELLSGGWCYGSEPAKCAIRSVVVDLEALLRAPAEAEPIAA